MSTPTSFNAWLREQGIVGKEQTWVLARRTKRILERYGDNVVTFSPRQYKELEEKYRVARREEVLMEIAGRHNFHNYVVLREAFEAGRGAR